MNNRIDKMKQYFQEQKRKWEQEARICREEFREDEAVFARIRMNVLDAFEAVFQVAVKQGAENEEKTTQFFRNKIAQIPQGWYTSLEQAKQHGDEKRAYLESIKLETAKETEQAFLKIWEGNV